MGGGVQQPRWERAVGFSRAAWAELEDTGDRGQQRSFIAALEKWKTILSHSSKVCLTVLVLCVVLCCVSHFSQHKKHGTQETGPPHHREQQADKKGDLWRKEIHLTHVPQLLSEPSPDTRLHGLFSAALLCFWVWLQWAGFFKQAPDHRSPDVTHKDRYDSYSDDELGFFSPYKV